MSIHINPNFNIKNVSKKKKKTNFNAAQSSDLKPSCLLDGDSDHDLIR